LNQISTRPSTFCYIPTFFGIERNFYLNQSMASGQPLKMVQRLMAHPCTSSKTEILNKIGI
jgi:hypothetical protein